MVTSPNEWKILKWDEKTKTNKQAQRQPYELKVVSGPFNIVLFIPDLLSDLMGCKIMRIRLMFLKFTRKCYRESMKATVLVEILKNRL